ncbi:MAG: DUF4395 domain-containing protein [Acidimicrobiales bacterium]
MATDNELAIPTSESESGRPRPSDSGLFGFPHPVNETSARVVAGGVVSMVTATIALDQPWILFPLTYGFAARVLTGPKLSPLGQIATRVVTPRLAVHHRYSPGPPKRLAQGMGLVLSGSSLLLYYGLGRKRLAYGLLAALGAAATLESVAGVCLACKMFPTLMRLGIVPPDTCAKCVGPAPEPEAASARPAADGVGSTHRADDGTDQHGVAVAV